MVPHTHNSRGTTSERFKEEFIVRWAIGWPQVQDPYWRWDLKGSEGQSCSDESWKDHT